VVAAGSIPVEQVVDRMVLALDHRLVVVHKLQEQVVDHKLVVVVHEQRVVPEPVLELPWNPMNNCCMPIGHRRLPEVVVVVVRCQTS